MDELTLHQVRITAGYWASQLELNARYAIQHQWRQLEQTGCLNNFRLAAGRGEGFREGFFFADSDAYKWLDAASRILAENPDGELQAKVDALIELIGSAQMEDGYLYTYNQLHFPGQRWVNLQVEHELYCLGHLIEAGVSHYQATGQARLLEISRRAADRLVADFTEAGPESTDGHEEIEIALLRLYQVTSHPSYLELARRFLERRGRVAGYAWLLLRQLTSTGLRLRQREKLRAEYLRQHPDYPAVKLPARNPQKLPAGIWLRLAHNLLSGKYTQQHAPLRQQSEPVGHAVRFAYLQTAAAMLARLAGDQELAQHLARVWQHMVTKRMFVTGGIGALPLIEGFGRDEELEPEIAYAETCAALGSMFWCWQMALLSGEPQYDDLFEWQLYNAASVGMGLDGCSYLYNNPLACRGGIRRAAWYDVPCCPSNLSRTYASLSTCLYSHQPGLIRVHQYASSEASFPWPIPLKIRQESNLPWDGRVGLRVETSQPQHMTLLLRLPGWANECSLYLNGNPIQAVVDPVISGLSLTACGYDPRWGRMVRLDRVWSEGDSLEMRLGMPIRLHRQSEKIPGCGGMVALSRGPLVYCLESADNPLDIFECTLDADSLAAIYHEDLLGGCVALHARTRRGAPLLLIPYRLWANRGESRMTVFVKV